MGGKEVSCLGFGMNLSEKQGSSLGRTGQLSGMVRKAKVTHEYGTFEIIK